MKKSEDKPKTGLERRLANLKRTAGPGRPVGSRNRRTVILAALKRIAEKKGMTAEEIEDAIQVSGVEKSLKGSFLHYAEISNGLYGKITDKSEVEVKGKSLTDLIAMAHGVSRSRRKKATKPSGKVS